MSDSTQPSCKTLSDEQLMLLIRQGNQPAMAELYDRYHRPLFHYFLRLLGNNQMLAEDFLQELFVTVIKKSGQFNPALKFKNWVFAIAQNMCKNEFRKTALVQQKHENLRNEQQDFWPDLETVLDQQLFKKVLPVYLKALTFEQRAAFLLHFQEGFSAVEISQIQNCPVGTVKSRLYHACQKLARLMSEFAPTSTGVRQNEK